jgi:glucose-6-phosphate 1-dehydrogenase
MTAPGALVIFGATGDLAQRMLFPSLYFLDRDGLLPSDLKIIGAARHKASHENFRKQVQSWVQERADTHQVQGDAWEAFAQRISYFSGDATDHDSFADLHDLIGDPPGGALFYLSTAPFLYTPIVEGLATRGLTEAPNRIILEKPIGKSRTTCEEINEAIGAHFSEERIFRIDHYLGKETVQNLIALRFANALFEPLWDRQTIDHVQISVAEDLGVDGRFSYYDEYGATRDMVQNHLLQLLCMIAMEPPADLQPESMRSEKVKVLRSLRPIQSHELPELTVRGQYAAGEINGEAVTGYTQEKDGKHSDTETYVALCAHIDNWRWAGVPFYLRTGKRLPKRASQIVIKFRDVPHSIFDDSQLNANHLVIRLQPEEAVSLQIMNKTPTLTSGDYELQPLWLNLSLDEAFKSRPRRRIAYERLLLEAINNNSTLFVRRDEAEAAWTWIDRIIEGWDRLNMTPDLYKAGNWGPPGGDKIFQHPQHKWFE